MPVLEPVPMQHLDQELQEMIADGRGAGWLSTPVPIQVLAYAPEISKEQLRQHKGRFEKSRLDSRLKELLRLRIASFNDCRACKAARKSDKVTEEDVAGLSSDNENFTPRERAALKFAELFATDHMAIGDDVFLELAKHFTKAEIIAVGWAVSHSLAGGRLMHVLRAWGDDEMEPAIPYEDEFAPEKARQAETV